MFGNLDSEEAHPFPSNWKDHIVARISESQKIGTREEDIVEIPSSVRLAPYDPQVYDTLVNNNGFYKKNVVVLHDPSK